MSSFRYRILDIFSSNYNKEAVYSHCSGNSDVSAGSGKATEADQQPTVDLVAEQPAHNTKMYSSSDFNFAGGDLKLNYLLSTEHSPVSVDQISRPSSTTSMASDNPVQDRESIGLQSPPQLIPVKVPPAYFVGTSSNQLSSSYTQSLSSSWTRALPSLQGQPLTRQRSATLPNHHQLDRFLALEQVPGDHAGFVDGYLDYTELAALVERADAGLQAGVPPLQASGALGGTYFLRDKGKAICLVCKPGDEEPNALNNPHQQGVDGSSYKGNIVPGSGMYREVVAYLLDKGFAGVPPTHLAKIAHPSLVAPPPVPSKELAELAALSTDSVDSWKAVEERTRKLCSVQQYARHECCAEDMGSNKFNVNDVQRLAVLDIRLLNLDRHEGNVLVSRANPFQRQLTPTAVADVALSPALLAIVSECELEAHSASASVDLDKESAVIAELVPVTVPVSNLTGALAAAACAGTRLTPGPVADDVNGKKPWSGLSVSLASSAPSTIKSSEMAAFFSRADASTPHSGQNAVCAANCSGKQSQNISPRSTYASVTAGPNYVHPVAGPQRLVPIDHGFSVPHLLKLESASLCWLHWPQSYLPIQPDTLQYIANLNVEEDIALIRRSLGNESVIPDEYLFSLHLGVMLLKTGAAAGLTLHDIGMLLTNETDEDDDNVGAGQWDEESFDKPAHVQAAVVAALRDTCAGKDANNSHNIFENGSGYGKNEFGKFEGTCVENPSISTAVALSATEIKPASVYSDDKAFAPTEQDLDLLQRVLRSPALSFSFLAHLQRHVQALVDERVQRRLVRAEKAK